MGEEKVSIEIVIAIIGLFITIVVNIATIAYFAGVIKSNQEHQKEMINLLRQEFREQLGRVEREQSKHNNLVERTFVNERDISVLKEQVKVENHRIQDLEDIIK